MNLECTEVKRDSGPSGHVKFDDNISSEFGGIGASTIIIIIYCYYSYKD